MTMANSKMYPPKVPIKNHERYELHDLYADDSRQIDSTALDMPVRVPVIFHTPGKCVDYLLLSSLIIRKTF